MKADKITKKCQARFESIFKLMEKLDPESSHAIHVSKLALMLFDEMNFLHSLGSKERELLQAAAHLHDIGWSQSAKAHHKSSMQMILKSSLPGWSEDEILLVANIARYHTKATPKSGHRKFAELSEENQQIVRKLAAILRVADALDRSHSNIIRELKCTLEGDQVKLNLSSAGDLEMEFYGVEKKRNLFKEIFGFEIVIDGVTVF
jgi:exopolyphosphatase/guanosine-5'-triphosphate,3'-diphosphate pyrophosphatase